MVKTAAKILVDTSVFVAAFDNASDQHNISHQFLEWTVDKNILITMPAHAWFEIWCTLKRLERWDKRFTGRPLKGAMQYPIEFIYIDEHFLKKYGNVDLKYIKAGDHIFLVVAKINGYPIITTDKKMRQVAESEGAPVFDPLEYMNLKK